MEEFLDDELLSARELCFCKGEGSAALERMLAKAVARGLQTRQVERAWLDSVCGLTTHQGVAILGDAPAYAELADIMAAALAFGENALLVLADHIQDPHNLGAIIRSAYGAEAQGIIIPKDRACSLTPAVAKASAGTSRKLPVARVTNLTQTIKELKKAGFWIVAAADRQAPPPWQLDLKRPLALVVGNEHKGIAHLVMSECDMLAGLPLQEGLDSLNASVAAGVMLFEIVRQRRS